MTKTLKKENKKGFTLTELIVVIVIIGILAAVLIPSLTGYIGKAKEAAAKEEASSYVNAYQTFVVEKGETFKKGDPDSAKDVAQAAFDSYLTDDLDMKVNGTIELTVNPADGTPDKVSLTGFIYTSTANGIKIKYLASDGSLTKIE